MSHRTLYLLLFCLITVSAFAQSPSFSLQGKVVTLTDDNILPGATVKLTQNDENALYTTTNGSGEFQFNNLSAGEYTLVITYVGYQKIEQTLNLEQNTELAKLRMAESEDYLQEVEVAGRLPRAEQKGDTTIFNAKAYKTLPDASTEDLIKKMPGIVFEDGKVQAQGEDVQKVLVDGKPFFGNDPTAALRNLPAEVVDKIQVFDKQSEQAEFTGFDDGQSAKTINIVTLANKRNGQFGKVYAGYGLDNRYALGGNINIFNGDQRFSIIGQSNNINIQNFSTEDLLGVVGNSGRRGGRGGGRGAGGGGRRGPGSSGGNVNDFLVGQQSGISQTNALGLNYSDNWGKKIEVTGSYFFNNSHNSADQMLSRETFLSAESSQFYDENSLTESDNFNHRFNMRMEYSIDDKNSIILEPSLSWQHNIGSEQIDGITFLENENLLSSTINNYKADLSALSFSNNLLFRHRFEKRGRTLSFRFGTQINAQEGSNELYAENTYYNTGFTELDSLDQNSTLDQLTNTYSANIIYTEPISERLNLMLNYEASLSESESDKFTYNFNESEGSYSLMDTSLTNVFESQYITQEFGGGLRFHSGKLSFMSRINYQFAYLDNSQLFPQEDDINRNFQSLLPSAMLHYRMEGGKNLRVFYRTNTNAPELSELQNVIDNSNPLMLTQGNPDLEQEYTHNLFARYASTNVKKANSFFMLIGGSYTSNYIAESTLIASKDTVINGAVELQQGAQLTRPINLENSWSLRSFASYGIPLTAIQSNLNFNGSLTYNRTPGLINEQKNYASNLGMGMGLVLSSNMSEYLDFTLSSRSNYNLVNNTLRADLNNNYFNQNTEFKIHGRSESGWFVETELNHQYYAGLSEAYNQDYLLINLSAGKKLFKNQLGELKLTVFDLLKQNNSISRTVSETYIEDVQTEVLQQFAMLQFTYNLRHFRL